MYTLVPGDSEVLCRPCEAFDFGDPPLDPIAHAKELYETMLMSVGIGLAANQVGFSHRAFAMKAEPGLVVFNPTVVWASDETTLLDEGCLSFPGLTVKVKRPAEVRVRYTLPNGEVKTDHWKGMTARVALHEMEHLDGALFFNSASKFHRDLAFRQRDQMLRRVKSAKQAKAAREAAFAANMGANA